MPRIPNINTPPSAKRSEAFGNKRVMVTGHHTSVFDHEFDVVHVVHDELGHIAQFESNRALDIYLETQGEKLRYFTLFAPAHNLDDEFRAWLEEHRITIENEAESPWCVEFSGDRVDLITMISENYYDAKSEVTEFNKMCEDIIGW